MQSEPSPNLLPHPLPPKSHNLPNQIIAARPFPTHPDNATSRNHRLAPYAIRSSNT